MWGWRRPEGPNPAWAGREDFLEELVPKPRPGVGVNQGRWGRERWQNMGTGHLKSGTAWWGPGRK